jgi:hypothetical protein
MFFTCFSFLLRFLPQKHPIFGHFWGFLGNVILRPKRGPGHLKKIAIERIIFGKSKNTLFRELTNSRKRALFLKNGHF